MAESGKIKKEVLRRRDEMIADLSSLVRIASVAPSSGGKGEADKAARVSRMCREAGLADITLDHDPAAGPSRPNLLATLPGERPDSGRLWVILHLDVVPPGDLSLWRHDPFEPRLENGRLYGRGAEDNGQAIVSVIHALQTLSRLGLAPRREIRIAAVSDEESGSEHGLAYLFRRRLFRRGDCFLVPDTGSRDGSLVEVAEKAVFWLRVEVLGRQGHAGMPGKSVNAMEAGSALASRVSDLRYLFSAEDPFFIPPVSTFNPTMRPANNSSINTIPGRDVFFVDCRLLPSCPVRGVREAFRRLKEQVEKEYRVKIKLRTVQHLPATWTDPAHPMVRQLVGLIHEERGVKAVARGIGGSTCASVIRRRGYPAVAWSTVAGRAHQPDEYALTENMVADALVMARLFRQLS